jgi:membrane-bound lytic murein transglycosylase MltF
VSYDTFVLFGNFLERTSGRAQTPAAGLGLRRSDALKKIQVAFIPVSRDEIFRALNEGRGDIAAATLTVTSLRTQVVDFTNPVVTDVNEIIVSGPGAPELRSLGDLAGQTVHVRKATSYYESLASLNDGFRASGKPPIRIVLLPDEIENEDKMEMLNAGLIKLAVLEEPLFDFWKQVFPRVHSTGLTVRRGGSIAWAVRRGNPKLRAALNQFISTEYHRNSANRDTIFTRYLKTTKWVKPVDGRRELARYDQTVEFFRRYSAKYRFDYLLVLAQAFQESRLNQSLVSPAGAIGLMQVLPSTGREMGVGDIWKAEANVHAGTRYLRQIVDQYFDEPQLTTQNRMMFAFASYNAGPNRIQRLRILADLLGFNSDVWFGNVELVVADRVGREPVQYVRNIMKYYVAYSLVEEVARERARARQFVR